MRASWVGPPAGSYCGHSSFTSAPTTFKPFRARKNFIVQYMSGPQNHGVWQAGATAASRKSASKVMYTGRSPTTSRTLAAAAAGPSSMQSSAEITVVGATLEYSGTAAVRMPSWTERAGSMQPSSASSVAQLPPHE